MTTLSNELALVLSAADGNTDAFGALYDAYIGPIYRFAYYKTWHRETAEDLTSQTFVKALEAIRSFDPTRGTFQAWLYQIARNTITDHYRAARSTRPLEDAWDLADDTDIPTDVDTRLKLTDIRTAITHLTPDAREIVLLRVWSGLSHAEIAAATGKQETAVKVAYSRAVTSLKKEILVALVLVPSLIER